MTRDGLVGKSIFWMRRSSPDWPNGWVSVYAIIFIIRKFCWKGRSYRLPMVRFLRCCQVDSCLRGLLPSRSSVFSTGLIDLSLWARGFSGGLVLLSVCNKLWSTISSVIYGWLRGILQTRFVLSRLRTSWQAVSFLPLLSRLTWVIVKCIPPVSAM